MWAFIAFLLQMAATALLPFPKNINGFRLHNLKPIQLTGFGCVLDWSQQPLCNEG